VLPVFHLANQGNQGSGLIDSFDPTMSPDPNGTTLLLAILLHAESIAAAALRHFDVDYEKASAYVKSSTVPPGSPEHLLSDIADRALEEAVKLEHYYVGPEHLLIALLRNRSSRVCMLLESIGVNPEEVLQEVFYILGKDMT